MKTSHVRLGIALAALAGFGYSTFLSADQPAPPKDRTNTTARANAAGQSGTLDQHFAACVILGNQNEIAAAKLAQQRSKSPEVKEFAQMMERDHQKFIGELEKYAGNELQGRRVGTTTDGQRVDARTENNRTNNPPPANDRARAAADAARPGVRGDGHATAENLLQIKREIADECQASAQRELSNKEGREFDACYIGMQLGAHMHMIDELKVLERHASGELAAALRNGRETAQKHYDRAKEIMKDIDKGETKTASSKS